MLKTVCSLTARGLILIVLLGCNISPQIDSSPFAKDGILDLQRWDQKKQKTLPLSGEWKFFWKQFLPTNAKHTDNSKFVFVKAPGVWNEVSFFGETIASYGYATYELKILLPSATSDLALSIPDIGTSYDLFANGKRIAEAGIIGETEETSNARYSPQITTLPESDSINLILHVSNFQNRWGGYWFPIRIGRLKDIIQEKQIQEGLSFAVCVSAAIMAIYNFLFFLFRKKDPAPILFSIHCILILIRALTTGERLGHILFPNLSWELLNRLEYASIYLSAPVLYAFLFRFCPTKFWDRFGVFLSSPFYLFSLMVLTLPNQIYTLTLNPILLYSFFTVIPCWAILLIYGVRRHYEGAWVLFLGYVGVMLCTLNDIFYSMGFINSTYLFPYGQISLIISHAIMISKRFSSSLHHSEDLSLKMKTLVSSTREIMTASSFASATRTTLQILSQNINESFQNENDSFLKKISGQNPNTNSFSEKGLFIYLPENGSSLWKQYSIDEENNSGISEMSTALSDQNGDLDFSSLVSPYIFKDRLLLPVRNEKTSFAVLDLPVGGFLNSDSAMDWAQGIAYGLALSIQNLLRQDREKLAIIGELSAEIAHDIGHHVILIQKVLRNLQKNEGTKEIDIAQAKKETEALANLSLDILEFSKKQIILDLKSVKIEDFFQGIREDLQLFFQGTGIRLSCEVSADGEIKLDPLRIRRLILNIAKNTIDAIGENGNFSIHIKKDSEALYIILKDNGPGLSEELKNAFYLSSVETKKPQGTGLGLFIVRKIALAHGGEVFINSELGKGSSFTVLLPC